MVKQCSWGPRVSGTDAQIKCRDFIYDELKKTCQNVRLQAFDHVWSQNKKNLHFWNVIGDQNWENAKVRVVLLTHWDSRPTADQESDPQKRKQPILGADDGASGVAVLLELARVLKVEPAKIGIEYLFVDGEDLGPGSSEMYLGAIKYAQNLPSPKPDYGILLDMIGNKDVRVPMEPSSMNLAPSVETAFYEFAKKIGMQETFPQVDGPAIEDDHLAINNGGVPCIDLIDFDYAPWHTLSDTVDKCSPESLWKIGYTLQKWVRQDEPFQSSKN
ncbi:MAG TPA: M28 family peptidase [Fimbriimonas sp.]|nr:M28 family peptidase [Fimbriimonas sp.]